MRRNRKAPFGSTPAASLAASLASGQRHRCRARHARERATRMRIRYEPRRFPERQAPRGPPGYSRPPKFDYVYSKRIRIWYFTYVPDGVRVFPYPRRGPYQEVVSTA
jgi:hypothetical protein